MDVLPSYLYVKFLYPPIVKNVNKTLTQHKIIFLKTMTSNEMQILPEEQINKFLIDNLSRKVFRQTVHDSFSITKQSHTGISPKSSMCDPTQELRVSKKEVTIHGEREEGVPLTFTSVQPFYIIGQTTLSPSFVYTTLLVGPTLSLSPEGHHVVRGPGLTMIQTYHIHSFC